jgi:hypothetical protein
MSFTIEFEKARLEYCTKLCDREDARAASLEKKSQFYLSFATAFVGAIFLKLDSIKALADLLSNNAASKTVHDIVLGAMIALLLALLSALLSILESVRVRPYKSALPGNVTETVFLTDSEFLRGGDESKFNREIALSFATALEINTSINDKKARWVSVAAYCILSSVFALFVIISVVVKIELF